MVERQLWRAKYRNFQHSVSDETVETGWPLNVWERFRSWRMELYLVVRCFDNLHVWIAAKSWIGATLNALISQGFWDFLFNILQSYSWNNYYNANWASAKKSIKIYNRWHLKGLRIPHSAFRIPDSWRSTNPTRTWRTVSSRSTAFSPFFVGLKP